MPATVTAIVIALNEAAHIGACLDALDWADACLVVDGGSSDGTPDIARQRGARVIYRAFDTFARQRNFALTEAQTEWTLFVDADERVSPESGQEIRDAVTLVDKQVAYWLPRRNLMLGYWVRHGGWWPDYQLRLMRGGAAHYDEARDPHELVEVTGEAGRLTQPLLHYNYGSLGQLLGKQMAYARREAASVIHRGDPVRLRHLFTWPLREFWHRYITLRGFRDGLMGLLLGLVMAWYRIMVWWKVRCALRLTPQRSA